MKAKQYVYVLFKDNLEQSATNPTTAMVVFSEAKAKELVETGQYQTYMESELHEADERTFLVNAICSFSEPDMDTCDKLTRLGYMEFCGNQWNEDWRWVRKNLEHAQMEMLRKIYNTFRLKRNEVIEEEKIELPEDLRTEEEREELDYLYGNKN